MSKFLYVKDQNIIDKLGNPIQLRGVGLGGWMLPEGYMWGSHGYYNRPRRFEELIKDYFNDEALLWWDKYYKSWISDEDFTLIKNHGYNSVRLPMNYRLLMVENDLDNQVVFNEYGFQMIDYTIEQCKQNDLYVILDLHGAPGGQTGANIDDSKDDYPHLYENRKYQEQLISLWKEIAKRYRDNETVCMYDLLNEPIPAHFSHLNQYLEPLHEELIKEIRKIDTNHIICIEGNNWASDFSTITKKLDSNLVLHFHKYWNPVSIELLEPFLSKREEFNLPLFMGEGGENDLYWYSASFKMYDQLNISWNFWSYKKRTNHNSVVSFDLPLGFDALLDDKKKLPKEVGMKLLNEFLENIKFENCVINTDVSNALFYRDGFFTTGGSYDYYGKGISFDVAKEYLESTLRQNDKTFICNNIGDTFKGVWNSLSTADIEAEMYPFVRGQEGDFYQYTFHITRTAIPHTIIVTQYLLDADFYINDELMDAELEEDDYVLFFETKEHKNVLTIKPFNDGVIKKIILK